MSEQHPSSTKELYLHDLISLLKEKAFDARQQRQSAIGSEANFAVGRLMAFHEVISLMQQQALAFGMDLDDLGLGGIVPERDLV